MNGNENIGANQELTGAANDQHSNDISTIKQKKTFKAWIVETRKANITKKIENEKKKIEKLEKKLNPVEKTDKVSINKKKVLIGVGVFAASVLGGFGGALALKTHMNCDEPNCQAENAECNEQPVPMDSLDVQSEE